MKVSSVKTNAVLNVVRTLMSLIFPLITFPYTSRVLGPMGTGKVVYAKSIVSYFAMLAMLGINTYGLREGAKIRDNRNALSKFYKEILSINLITTFIAYILLFFAITFLPRFSDYRQLIIVLSSSILFTTLGVDWLYGAVEDYKYITIRSIIFQVIGIFLLFILVRDNDDYLQYASLSVITNVGSNIFNFFHSRKYIDINFKCQLELKKHLKPLFILFGTAVAISIYTVLDSTMLGYICGDEQVGLYHAATKINRIILNLISAIGAVLTPRLSNYIENQRDEYNKLLSKASNIYLLLCLPSAVGLCFLAKPIIDIFCGYEYQPALLTMQVMCPIILFIPYGQFFSNLIFTPFRKDKYSLFPVIFGALTNVVLNLLLIPRFGALGAGIATVIAEFTVTTIKLFLSKKVGIKIFDLFKNWYQYLIATTIMFFILLLIKQIHFSTNLFVIISILCGIIIYFLSLLLMKNKYVIDLFHSLNKKLFKKS